MNTPEGSAAGNVFYNIAFGKEPYYRHQVKELFGIETLMLGGGAALNWSFIQAGMCDEVSVVIAAVADGSSTTQTLFMARTGLSDETPVRFDLQSTEVRNGGGVWLRYQVCPAEGV